MGRLIEDLLDFARGGRHGMPLVDIYIVKPVDFDQFMNAVGELGRYWLRLNESPL